MPAEWALVDAAVVKARDPTLRKVRRVAEESAILKGKKTQYLSVCSSAQTIRIYRLLKYDAPIKALKTGGNKQAIVLVCPYSVEHMVGVCRGRI